MNHIHTQIYSSWLDKSRFIDNIPQPACIINDDINILSDSLPNIFLHVEPNVIIPNIRDYLINNHTKYHTILTYDDEIVKRCLNSRFYSVSCTWINKEYYMNIDTTKKQFKISNLAGSKLINNSSGHMFRQLIHHNQSAFKEYPITFFRSIAQHPHIIDYGNNPFISKKEDLFDSFQFSIVIENSRQTNYFSEKLIDCLITKTIPIYYGCPNISKFFDISYWIIIENPSIDELQCKLSIIDSSYYSKHINLINKNYNEAINYSDFNDNLNRSITHEEYLIKYN